jgi:hypothetical protein
MITDVNQGLCAAAQSLVRERRLGDLNPGWPRSQTANASGGPWSPIRTTGRTTPDDDATPRLPASGPLLGQARPSCRDRARRPCTGYERQIGRRQSRRCWVEAVTARDRRGGSAGGVQQLRNVREGKASDVAQKVIFGGLSVCPVGRFRRSSGCHRDDGLPSRSRPLAGRQTSLSASFPPSHRAYAE